jgi:hypothetical protein
VLTAHVRSSFFSSWQIFVAEMTRTALVALCVAIGLCAVVAAAATPALSQAEAEAVQFAAWKVKFNKQYATADEEAHALENYRNTTKRVADKNAAPGQRAHFAVGKFADLSPAEFRAQYLNLDGRKMREELAKRDIPVLPPQPLKAPLPADFDWAMQNPSPLTYVKVRPCLPQRCADGFCPVC